MQIPLCIRTNDTVLLSLRKTCLLYSTARKMHRRRLATIVAGRAISERKTYGPSYPPKEGGKQEFEYTQPDGFVPYPRKPEAFYTGNPAAGAAGSQFGEWGKAKPLKRSDFEEFEEKGKPKPGTGAAEERQMDEAARKDYVRSTEFFANKTVKLNQSFAGSEDARIITPWERIWWDYVRFYWTYETLAGKDRFGNVFVRRWFFYRGRNETRKMYRKDKDKRHQPYGAIPTDSKLWEAWLRTWRHDPPTPEEEETFRKKAKRHVGPHSLGDEAFEDTLVRTAAHTTHANATLQELDKEETYNKFLYHFDDLRKKDGSPHKEASTWTAGFVRGDYFYNEEEVETMRTNLSHLFRDREWQTLEMKRQTRMRKQPTLPHMPDDYTDPNSYQGDPVSHYYDRIDGGVPCVDGVEQLTTPEIQKLRVEVDALDEERTLLRRELGLTDLTDFRDGRAPIVKDSPTYAPDPVSKRWKPQCWGESWGTGMTMMTSWVNQAK